MVRVKQTGGRMKLIGIAWWSDSSSASASVDLSLISFWSMHLAFHLDSNILVRFFFTINSAAHECTCVVFVVCQSFQHSCSCAAKGTKYVYTFCVFDFYFLHFFPYLYVLFLLLSSFFFSLALKAPILVISAFRLRHEREQRGWLVRGNWNAIIQFQN